MAIKVVIHMASPPTTVPPPVVGQELRVYASNPHYLQYQGNPTFLLGYVNGDKSQVGVLDQLAGKTNYLRIWNINHLRDGSSSWPSAFDGASNYEWGRPWPTVAGKADFDQWNETFWSNLQDYLTKAQVRNFIVGITIWDGQFELPGSTAGVDSVWNSSLNVQGIQWAYDYASLVAFPNPTNTGGASEKRVYYQRRWIDRLITELASYPNILIELNNEDFAPFGSVSENWWLWWAQYFRDAEFNVVAVNSGNSEEGALVDSTFAGTSLVDMKSYHKRDATAITSTRLGYNKIIVADADNQCPDFAADSGRHMAWRSLCRGGHWVDFVCGAGDVPAYPNATKLTYYGYVLSFLSSRNVPFAQMQPNAALTSSGLCLTKPNTHYLVYPEALSTVSVNLTAAAGTLNYEWYNPITGTPYAQSTVAGGASRNFTPPAATAVLWIYP